MSRWALPSGAARDLQEIERLRGGVGRVRVRSEMNVRHVAGCQEAYRGVAAPDILDADEQVFVLLRRRPVAVRKPGEHGSENAHGRLKSRS